MNTIGTTMTCPNPHCGEKSYPMPERRANLTAGILLLIFLFPFGVLYFILYRGFRYVCPHCNIVMYHDGQ